MTHPYSFDRAAGYYDDSRGMPRDAAEQVAWTIVEQCQATRGTRFVEIGIGTGRIALPLVDWGHRVAGVDLSPAMMARLRAKLSPGQVVGLAQADACALPFAAASAGAVILVQVLHLVPGWRGALAEARRVLAPGGTLLHSANRRDPASPSLRLHSRWHDLVAARGESAGRPGAPSAGDVIQALRDMGAEVHAADAAQWTDTVTVAGLLADMAARRFSDSWSVSDDVLRVTLTELEAWARAEYGDLDRPREEARQVAFDVARWPDPARAGRVRVHDDTP